MTLHLVFTSCSPSLFSPQTLLQYLVNSSTKTASKMSGASNDFKVNSQQWARDYPEPYESAFERYLARNEAAFGTQHRERK
jgi:hypothetical protein